MPIVDVLKPEDKDPQFIRTDDGGLAAMIGMGYVDGTVCTDMCISDSSIVPKGIG